MTTELKPCPICKEECSTHSRTEIEDDSVACDDCKYATEANTLEEAIRLHNSIPRREKCRWRREGARDGAFFNRAYVPECSPGATCLGLAKYCSDCGKEIEEVEE